MEYEGSPEPTAEAADTSRSGETKGKILGLLVISLEERPLWSWGSTLTSTRCLATFEGAAKPGESWARTVRNRNELG